MPDLADIRRRIHEMTGDDYPLLGLLVDFEAAIRADAVPTAQVSANAAWTTLELDLEGFISSEHVIAEVRRHRPAIEKALLDERDALREVAQEVWDSIPASFDPADPMVQRHARALNALRARLDSLGGTE